LGLSGVAAHAQVTTPAELTAALEAAGGEAAEKLCLIEVQLHPEDCSRELLEWGARVAAYNSRPPQIT
jgi:TPP-dependent 2-oxoacid decarboxylase